MTLIRTALLLLNEHGVFDLANCPSVCNDLYCCIRRFATGNCPELAKGSVLVRPLRTARTNYRPTTKASIAQCLNGRLVYACAQAE